MPRDPIDTFRPPPPRPGESFTEFHIAQHDGRIILRFPRPAEYVVLSKEEARSMAQTLLAHASGIILPG